MTPLEQTARAVGHADVLALTCHIGPDGDALGSMLGLGIAAKNAGKKVVASFGSPFVVPQNLAFLPRDLLVSPDEFPEEPEMMVVFDVGAPDRLGELATNASKAENLVVIDHHVTNEGFGDVSLVDPEAAATAELVVGVLDLLGWPITPEIATCLLTALVTDTGRFQYVNTTPTTLELAARMVSAGARPDEIARHVYEETPFGYLKAAAKALTRVELDDDLGLVTAVVTHEDLSDAGIDWGDIDNLINLIRLPQEADTAVLVKVHDRGRVKLSLRSRGDTDVGSLAADMGGGGHRLAAGFTFQGEPEKVIAEIKRRLAEYR